MNSTKSKVCPELDELQMDDDGKYMLCRPSANKHCRRLSLRPMKLHCTSRILWRGWRWIRNVPNTKCNTQNNEEKRRWGTKVVPILLFSCITRTFSSSQVKVRAIWSDPMNLAKNKSLALNLLNQLTTESWEWHPQQNICYISLGCLLSQQFRLYRNLLC